MFGVLWRQLKCVPKFWMTISNELTAAIVFNLLVHFFVTHLRSPMVDECENESEGKRYSSLNRNTRQWHGIPKAIAWLMFFVIHMWRDQSSTGTEWSDERCGNGSSCQRRTKRIGKRVRTMSKMQRESLTNCCWPTLLEYWQWHRPRRLAGWSQGSEYEHIPYRRRSRWVDH